jgi:hypothetical protein
MVQKVAFLSK